MTRCNCVRTPERRGAACIAGLRLSGLVCIHGLPFAASVPTGPSAAAVAVVSQGTPRDQFLGADMSVNSSWRASLIRE